MSQISEDADGNPCFLDDCQRNKEECPNCIEGDLYLSPDAYEMFGDMER